MSRTRTRQRPACLLTAALLLGVLAAPAAAGPSGPGGPAAGRLLGATEVAPRPVPLALASSTVPAGDPADGAALGRRVSLALSASGARTIGAAVDVDGYGAVLRRNATLSLPPASTQKSYTALAALVALSPQARYHTRVVRTATPVAGTLRGHVWLVASGDPYLTMTGLRTLARGVRAAGITTVAGDVRLADYRYDARRTAPGWKASFMPGQSGPLATLALNRNTWRTDAAFLADPGLPAAVRFRDYLRLEGVRVTGAVRREKRPAGAVTVAQHVSAPLPAVVRRALKSSDNFASELLLKEVGRVVRGEGTTAGGVAATRQVLGAMGVATGSTADGSGLSSYDRKTPAGELGLLRVAGRSAVGPAFRGSLPLGCRDGTLVRRFCGTAAEARVSAKTGTLYGVRVLAGYTTTASGRPVRFAFQLSGVTDGAKALRAIDRAVVVLAAAPE